MWKLFTKKDKRSSLEKEIEEVLEVMKYHQPESEEYGIMVKNLDMLYKMQKSLEKENKWIGLIGTGITSVVSIVTVAMILDYEKEDSLTSKAIGFIIRGRV